MSRKSMLSLFASLTLVGFIPSIASAAMSPESVEAIPYVYGMKLDVSKLISIEHPKTSDCEVVQSKMTFIDRSGELNAISFPALSEVCGNQG